MDEIDKFADAIRNPRIDPDGGPLESDASYRDRIISASPSAWIAVSLAGGMDLDAIGALRGIKRKGLL